MKKTAKIASAVLCVAIVLSLFVLPASADNKDAKLLAITFDDGPSMHTTTLLNALKERGAKATFFIVGNRVKYYFGAVERMYDEGHQVASHTYSHKYLTQLSRAEIRDEIENAETYLRAAGAQGKIYLRAPGGKANETVQATAGTPLIRWDVDPDDWKDRDAKTVRKRIVENARDGDIILVHDLYQTSVEGAIMAIDDLMAQGYEFVTVEELLTRRGITPADGEIYFNAKNKGTNLPPTADLTLYTEPLSEHWAYESIQRVLDMGIYKLPNGGAFSPEKGITRGLFASMLGRLAGVAEEKNVKTGFTDVPSDIYQAVFVKWVTDNGIMRADGNKFRLSDIITKEEMLAALDKYIAYTGFGIKSEKIPDYEDASEISDWARAGVNFCKYVGILNKGEYTNCDAQKGMTKAEAAEYICRAIDFLKSPTKYISRNSYCVMRARAGLAAEPVKNRASFWQRIRNFFR